MNRERKQLHAKATAPDGAGSFDGLILYGPVEGDQDGERVSNFTNLPTTVPMFFQHAKGDSPIGTISARLEPGGRLMRVHGQLHLSTKMSRVVHERMCLPRPDPECLSELSISYLYLPSENTKDTNGVTVIHNAELTEVSVVRAGAQATLVTNVKSAADEIAEINATLDRLTALRSLAEIDRQLDALSPRRLSQSGPHAERQVARRRFEAANQGLISRSVPILDPRDMSEIT